MAKRKPPDEDGIPEWVLTFGDLMTLLLCFFILLAAFSEIKKDVEYQEVVKSLQEAFGYQGGIGRVPNDSDPNNIPNSNPSEDYASRKLDDKAMAQVQDPNMVGKNEKVSIVNPGEKFVIGGSLRFEAGSTVLSPAVKRTLKDTIAKKIKDRNNKIEIRGHAYGPEDRKASGLDYIDLSFKRAKAVARFLIDECSISPTILEVVAVGDSEPAKIDRSGSRSDPGNWRVQVVLTEVTVDQVNPDPFGTGR